MEKPMTSPTNPPKMPPPSMKASAPVAPRAIPSFAMPSTAALPPRLILNGMEGWGKTSLAANAPGAAIIQSRGETGYQTLVSMGRVPVIPATLADSWDGLLGLLDQLAADPGAIKTLILDALGGFEHLCHEFVCNRDFKGDWGDKGFGSFKKGVDGSIADWLSFLGKLDKIREKGVGIYLLSHVQVKPFKNPTGADFDRYECACDKKTWGVTHKWADAVLFATFRTIVDKQGGKSKGIGGVDRVIYTERRDAFDAKNRHGMPEEIDIPGDPAEAYQIVSSYLNPARQ